MMFAIPGVVPVPQPCGMVALPAGAIGYQLAAGRKQIRLPRFILEKRVSRRALAVAIHATLPVLEAVERVVRPRWSWASHPVARRAIGLFVFLLAVAIVYPLSGFAELHALSIFVLSLGMAEKDGLVVTIGLIAGMLSLAVLAASGLSLRSIRTKIANVLRSIGKKLGLNVIANYLEKLGFRRLARFITIEWSELVVTWDPEKQAASGGPRTGTEAHRKVVRMQTSKGTTRHPNSGVARPSTVTVRPASPPGYRTRKSA